MMKMGDRNPACGPASEKRALTVAEPRSAPSSAESPALGVIRPLPANPVRMSAVAVPLCRINVAPSPAATARWRRDNLLRRTPFSQSPQARVTPVRTIRTPHSSMATPAIRLIRISAPGRKASPVLRSAAGSANAALLFLQDRLACENKRPILGNCEHIVPVGLHAKLPGAVHGRMVGLPMMTRSSFQLIVAAAWIAALSSAAAAQQESEALQVVADQVRTQG